MSLPMRSVGRFAAAFLLSAATTSWAAPPGGADNRTAGKHAPLKLFGPAAGDQREVAGRLLDAVQRERRLIAAQVRAEVENELRTAQSQAERNPDQVLQSLKLMMDRVIRVPELSAGARAELRAELATALRTVSRRAATNDVAETQAAAQRAAAEDRLHATAALTRDQQKLEQLMDRFESLMDEGRYTVADALGEREIAEVAANAPVATSTRLVAHQRGAHVLNVALANARHKGVVGTLATVETSHVPFADDQPMVYPRAEVWEELSRRRAKYARTDLSSVRPSEARIRRELDAPTSMEFIETPLNEAVGYLKDLHGIEIQLDARALEQAGIFSDTPVTTELKGVSLRSGLRFLLRPLDLTYVIKDEVLLVTTLDAASQEIVTRVYPVEDLVIPIRPISMGAGGVGNMGISTPFGSGQSPGGSSLGFPGPDGQGFNGLGNGPGFNGQGNGQF